MKPKLRVEMQRETGRPARPTVDDLAKHAHIAHAFAQLRSEANKIGAVKATCIAINFAMALHELPDIMNAFPMKMLHEVMRRDFGTHVKKMHELRRGETNDIVERWGFESGYRSPSPHTHPLPHTHTHARARAPHCSGPSSAPWWWSSAAERRRQSGNQVLGPPGWAQGPEHLEH